MGTSRRKIILIALAILLISFFQSCKQTDSNESYMELIELLKTNNKCIHISNRSIISLLSNDSSKIDNLNMYKKFDEDVYTYFDYFRSDFIFELENGKNKFFDADTVKIFQIKNWNDKNFIFKYNVLSIDSLNSKIITLNKEMKSYPSSKFYFDEKKIYAIVDKLKNKDNNAYDEIKTIEIMKNYYLISLNKIMLDL